MKIPEFKVVPGRYTEIKFYDNEVILLIKALKHYQYDYPKNSWTRDFIARLEKQKFLQEQIQFLFSSIHLPSEFMTDYRIKNGEWKEFSLHPEVKDISGIALKRDLKLFKKHEQLLVGRDLRAILRKFYNDIGERHFFEDQIAEKQKKDFCAVLVCNLEKGMNLRFPISRKTLQETIDNKDILDLYSDKPSKGFS